MEFVTGLGVLLFVPIIRTGLTVLIVLLLAFVLFKILS